MGLCAPSWAACSYHPRERRTRWTTDSMAASSFDCVSNMSVFAASFTKSAADGPTPVNELMPVFLPMDWAYACDANGLQRVRPQDEPTRMEGAEIVQIN
jgi:hypothetical protein